MSQILSSINADTIKIVALGLSGTSIVIGLVLLMVIKSIVGKIISVAIFMAISVGGFTQRAAITDCVDKIQAQEITTSMETSCTFFGQEITLKVPGLTK